MKSVLTNNMDWITTISSQMESDQILFREDFVKLYAAIFCKFAESNLITLKFRFPKFGKNREQFSYKNRTKTHPSEPIRSIM